MSNSKQLFLLMKEAGCRTKEECLEFYNGFMHTLSKKAAAPVDPFGELLKGLFGGLGSTFSSEVVKGTLKGVENAVRSSSSGQLSSRHKTFIEKLIKEDSVLRSRKPETIVSHYETLVRMSPSISLDKNAVSSFLRYSTQHEGIDPSMLRQLAELEEKVNKNIKASNWF